MTNDEDCDDNRDATNPDALEECDGLDNDCNSDVDDGLPADAWCRVGMRAQPPGYVLDDQDCDDSDPSHRKHGTRFLMYDMIGIKCTLQADDPDYRIGANSPTPMRDMFASYASGELSAHLILTGPDPTAPLRKALEKTNGSLGKKTANQLGISVGKLRNEIELYGLQDEVNALRKRCGRLPARFKSLYVGRLRFYVEHWP